MRKKQDVGQLSPVEMADAEVYTIKTSQKNMKLFKEEAVFHQVADLLVFLIN